MGINFAVEGKPVTQGSMTAVYNRKTGRASIRHTQSLALMKWRRAIAEAAKDAGAQSVGLPVVMSIIFGMPKPANAKYPFPMHRDLDKLIRAVLDALTGVAYDDDKQIIDIHAIRVYGTQTMVSINYVAWEDAEGVETYAGTYPSTRQLRMPLLWQEGDNG